MKIEIVHAEPAQPGPLILWRARAAVLWAALGLVFLLGVGLWLRWHYVRDISLSVDEFTTLWAARQTLDKGAPIMPSGVLYTRGLLTTYLTAAFLAVAGESYTVGRLPSLIFGLAAVLAIFLIGRREWNVRVAWLATLGLALLPEAVVWSGRARFYAQLLLFVLLTLWAAWRAIAPAEGAGQAAPTRKRAPLLFALFFTLALVAQEQTILLYPSIVLAMWLWRGWRYLWQPAVVMANLICVVAMALRFLLEQVGQPGYFAAVQTYKPYLNLWEDAPDLWANYRYLFLAPERLPWTLAALLAVAVALILLVQLHGSLPRLSRFHQATLFFALHLGAVLLILVFVVGGSWSDPRYVFMLQTLWLLVGAAGAVWLVERLAAAEPVRWLLTGVLALLVVASLWPLALNATREDMEGYGEAFAYVADHLRPGDVVMTPQPPACALVLGRPCDYFARERGYEPYAIERDGLLIDRWSGAPVLHTPAQLAQVIQEAPRVWFVADHGRLARRYRTPFLTLLIEQFDQVQEVRGAVVLLAEGWRTRPTPTVEQRLNPQRPVGPLVLRSWARNDAVPGQQLYMTITWDKVDSILSQINTSLQVVAADGTRITQKDGPPAGGFALTYDFALGQIPDIKKLTLPEDLPPGRYRLDLVAYEVATLDLLAEPVAVDWFRIGAPPLPPAVPVEARWQNGLALLGHDELPPTLTPGSAFAVRLVWQTAAPLAEAYTVFLHLVGPDGQISAQADRAPEGGFYPTWGWDLGEPVVDTYPLQLPAQLPAGEYRLLVGFYQPQNFQRPLLADGSDALELARWTIP